MEQYHVAHTCKGSGIGKNIARRGNEKDIRPLPVKTGLHLYAGNLFNVVGKEIEHILKRMGLNPEMISGSRAIGNRRCNPVDIQAEEVQQFTAHDGNFRRIDAVGAKNRAAPAFRTLKQIIPPFF